MYQLQQEAAAAPHGQPSHPVQQEHGGGGDKDTRWDDAMHDQSHHGSPRRQHPQRAERAVPQWHPDSFATVSSDLEAHPPVTIYLV